MLMIRLQRTGRRNVPAYRLVCTEKTSPPKGKVQEYLGHYLPTRDPSVFEYKKERIEHWIKQGAQPSDTVARLLKRDGITGMETFVKVYAKQKKKKEVEEAQPSPESSDSSASSESSPEGDTAQKKE